jgi:hypothetical protein
MPIEPGPTTVGKAAVGIFVYTAGRLHYAIERHKFGNN